MKKLIALSSIVLFLYGCAGNSAPAGGGNDLQSLPVLKIATTDATTQAEYPASIEGTTNVEIRPQVDGFLDKLFVDEGAYVNAGQPLFKINDQPYREQLNNALANLHAQEAAVINAQLEVDKVTPLVQNKVVSDYQLKAANAAYKIAVANEEQAKAMVGAAQINLNYTLITAPVSGYIGLLPKKQGSLVSRSAPEALTTLSDVHQVRVYFSLSENDFTNFKAQYPGNTINDKIKKLQPVSLILADNSVYPMPGRIDMIDGEFDKNTGAITIRASFPNAQGLLRSGNTGKIRLSLTHPDAILVPQSSTMEIQDKTFVFTVGDSDKVSKQPIVIIGKSGTDYLVSDGVKPGDRIVFSGIDHLQAGMMIKPEAMPVVSAAK
jgi:membrane fusion protein (multidrug efflux system)